MYLRSLTLVPNQIHILIYVLTHLKHNVIFCRSDLTMLKICQFFRLWLFRVTDALMLTSVLDKFNTPEIFLEVVLKLIKLFFHLLSH